MALKLLSRKLRITLHIALFVCFALLSAKPNAQSVLLPGDVVIVSANTDTQSIDFIPLIDIEEGTSLYFSSGVWEDSTQTLDGNELAVTFLKDVDAGTNIHINAKESERFNVAGNLDFEGTSNRIFAYQKAGDFYRHLFAVGWGNAPVWNATADDSLGSDVPETLFEDNLYLMLGTALNHQYYIRNGASGTRDLLLKFVKEEANWRSSEKAFPPFGTSFNLLKPPVILFERSISTVAEDDSAAVLNVAIYEHDGSRLTVDVIFDSTKSIISPRDIKGFSSKTLNFTGLIGDAMYEVHVPIHNDSVYEGRETGIFTLQNLTKGNFGDFLNHSLVINENETPKVEIVSVLNNEAGNYQIEIRNNENGVVSLNGWQLSSGDRSYTFAKQTSIYPQKSLLIKNRADNNSRENREDVVYADLESSLLNEEGGRMQLLDYNGEVISEVDYRRIVSEEKPNVTSNSNNLVVDADAPKENAPVVGQPATSQIAMGNTAASGWKIVRHDKEILEAFPEKEWMVWDEQQTSFAPISEASEAEDPTLLFGFFTPDEAEDLLTLSQSNTLSENANAVATDMLAFHVSAFDVNENERIDRLEGLNLVSNTLEEAISVKRLLEVMESDFPEVEVEPIVYGFERARSGALRYIPLIETDSIAPGAPFWLKLETVQPKKELQISKQVLMSNAEQVAASGTETSGEEINRLAFEFEVADPDLTETMAIVISTPENFETNLPDLNSYSKLQLADEPYFHAAIFAMNEFYSKLHVPSETSASLHFPIHFDMHKSGSVGLSVTEWPQILDEWEVIIEDLLLEKEYILRDGFTLNFEYSGSTMKEQEVSDQADREQRFILHLRPPGTEKAETEEVTDTPRELELYQNFPNPFNPITTISFFLPEPREVKLSVFNIVGQPIAVIVEGTLSAGEKHYEWDARERPSGMYIYQLEVGNKVMTRKMTLVK
tara:strand:+ start:8660 stop:11494 length:2835 start_codon:yes stop_codon:yes gene_type:complete